MKRETFGSRVSHATKALRCLRKLTQNEIADEIHMERSVYCKLENGDIALTVDTLKLIATALDTSVFQILAFAEADIMIDFRYTPLSEILIRYTIWMEHSQNGQLSPEELEFIISKMKSYYEVG